MFLRFIICITYQILHTAPTCIKCNLCWYLIVTKLCSKKVMETELSFYRLSDMCKKTSHSWNWPIYYYKPQQYPNQWLSQIGKQLSGKFFSGDDSCQQKNMLTFGQEVDQTQAAITTTSNPTPQSEAPSFSWIHPQSIFDTPLPHPLRCTPLKLVMNPPPQKKILFLLGNPGSPTPLDPPLKKFWSPPLPLYCASPAKILMLLQYETLYYTVCNCWTREITVYTEDCLITVPR